MIAKHDSNIEIKKKCPGVYLIIAKAVPFAASAALSYLTTVHSAILIRSQLEYDRGREYTDSGHAFILAISHAHRYAYTSAVHSACGYTARHSQRYTLCQLLHQPSLQSCQVQVVNYAPRGMSLLETSSLVLYYMHFHVKMKRNLNLHGVPACARSLHI